MMRATSNTLTLFTFLAALLVCGNIQALEAKSPSEKGMVNFDLFKGKEAKVEVNVTGSLINMAANIMAKEDPKMAKILADIKGAFVRVFSSENLGGEKPDDIVKNYEKKLTKEGWETMVRVRDEGSHVMVLNLIEGNLIRGLFVAIADSGKELVLVNLFGKINPEDLAYLAKGKVPIPGLEQLGKIAPDAKIQKDGDKPQSDKDKDKPQAGK